MPDHASELAAVLAYYDLFDYPLTLAELQRFVPKRDAGETRHALQQLLRAGAVFRSGDFYALRDDPGLARRRLVANHRAEPLLARAEKLSRALVRFPFVRAVLISGSLSKGCAAPGADIDYFIITAPGRLWTARTCMHLRKKLSYFSGRQHDYCMNYYIDEEALEIREKNLYTAMEIVTLLPMRGAGIVERFFAANAWTENFFPPHARDPRPPGSPGRPGFVARAFEYLLSGRGGDRLEDGLRTLTVSRWRKKENRGKRSSQGKPMSLDAAARYCKPNPVYFQHALLERYQARLSALHARFPFMGEKSLQLFFTKERIT